MIDIGESKRIILTVDFLQLRRPGHVTDFLKTYDTVCHPQTLQPPCGFSYL